jgi:tetratricopeptide (TPR) repeat protein
LIAPELNPDWYRVRYNIATLYANRSADPKTEVRGDRELARAKAKELAIDAIAGLQAKGTKKVPGLVDFLQHSVLPAALLIFAGTAGRHPKDSSPTGAPADLKELRAWLEGNRLTAQAALEFVKRNRPNPGVLYDMACAYAQLGRLKDARDCLETAMTTAPATERRRLARLAPTDPSLDPLLDEAPDLKAKLKEWESGTGAKKRRKASTKPRKRAPSLKKARRASKQRKPGKGGRKPKQ